MDAVIAQLNVQTPPANPRHLAEKLASPTRMADAADSHRDALRKLDTAVRVALHNGATWEEISQAVMAAAVDGAGEGRPGAALSATARASIHDGDDRL